MRWCGGKNDSKMYSQMLNNIGLPLPSFLSLHPSLARRHTTTKAGHGGLVGLSDAMDEDRLLLDDDAHDDQKHDADDGEKAAARRAW